MNEGRCSRCKTILYEWRLPHKCAPRWEVIEKDVHDEDDPIEFFSDGYDEERVAEQFAASRFDGTKGHEWEIWVRKNLNSEWKKFTVNVEAVPSFTAVRLG